ncbi:energy transducer TonB [Lacinutrix sp. Bg11-31]|uniref:energy transducer TonB n=1 Tax=Lacinutrix sp. Bg11-31 TaxID=2057808 RepID=UPI000C30DEB8|nr:energy transducer TonB [Lacinutrix sp. Bg11-31]AUC82657.1 hypothetical protein CW733_11175 [Lacinutrix sp. Bg11-31]
MGFIESTKRIDSVIKYQKPKKEIITIGKVITVDGDMILEEHSPTELYPVYIVDEYPEFKETTSKLSKEENKKQFQSQLNQFVKNNFKKTVVDSLELIVKQKIYVDFEITNTGNIIIKRTRAYYPELEKEAERVLKKLPKLMPARKDGKAVSVSYILPIIFNIEE